MVRLSGQRDPQQLLRLMTSLLMGAWSRNEVMYSVHVRSLSSPSRSFTMPLFYAPTGVESR